MDRAKLDDIIMTVSGVLNPAGYDCIEAEWQGHDKILRLFVDMLPPEGGITLDGCVKATKLLEEVPALDAKLPDHYTLEVSSPGVERPLRRRADFEKHVGKNVDVRLTDKVQDRRNGTGKLVAVAGEEPLITVETEQGPWQFPLARLHRASLVYDWAEHKD